MANELICSVCEQRIERNPLFPSYYRHAAGTNLNLVEQCCGAAVPKAPEPTGDDKVTPIPPEACDACGAWNDEHNDWQRGYCEGRLTGIKQENERLASEPKAPDVIEGEFSNCPQCGNLLEKKFIHQSTGQLDCNDMRVPSDAMWAEYDRYVATKKRAEKAEKERDAALALYAKEVSANSQWTIRWNSLIAANQELQRDLDAAKELLKESKSLAGIGYRIGEADMRGHDKIGERWGKKQVELIARIDNLLK